MTASDFVSRIEHAHIYDNDGFQEPHSIVVQGSVRWRAVVETLHKTGYVGILIDEHQMIE